MATLFQQWRLRLTVAFVTLAGTGRAQSVIHWSSYGMPDGLSEPVFNSVSFTPQGQVLATSPNAPLAAELDGYSVTNFPAPPEGSGRMRESPGGQRWALAPQGLRELRGTNWLLHPIPEIAAATRAAIPPAGGAPPFIPIRQGCVLFLLPAGLYEFSTENPDAPQTVVLRRSSQSQIGSFTGMAMADDDVLWISGTLGLARIPGPVRNIDSRSPWQEYPCPAQVSAGPLSQPVPDHQGGLVALATVATNHQTTVVTFDGQTWAMLPAGERKMSHAWRGPANSLWASTSDALCQWVPGRTNWVENEDISPGQINDVAVEPEGAFWLATANGLFRGASQLWWKASLPPEPGPSRSRAESPGRGQLPALPLPTPKSMAGYASLPDGTILCATLDQLWESDGRNWSLSKYRFNHINALLAGRDGRIWLASNGGLFRYCAGVWLDNGPAEGLPDGAIAELGEDTNGLTWAATPRGVYEFHSEADADPPRTSVRQLAGADRQLVEGETLNFRFTGQDKWKYTPPARLLYSYQLDQLGWSPFREIDDFSLPGAAAGRHYFQVRTMDRNGHVDPAPAALAVTILTPWFHDFRLWIVLCLGAGAALFFAAVAWHRHRLLARSYAAVELAVAERTRELEIATRELLHSQKMNALGTLAAGIAHDFNNILSIIKGSAQIIADNPGHPEKIRARVARIKTVVQQGAEMVEAMLGFSRGTGSAAALCNINEVVADTLKLLGDRFQRETAVQFIRADHLPELAVPREFIQQMLINFIFNAAEAASGHDTITLATTLTERLPPNVILRPAASAAFVLIAVRDQGAGMTPEIQARIFEPFFTTKALSSRRGTGLGLSMVYELAKKIGAGLAVRSAVGEGSEFTLILPVPPRPAGEPSSPAQPLPAPHEHPPSAHH